MNELTVNWHACMIFTLMFAYKLTTITTLLTTELSETGQPNLRVLFESLIHSPWPQPQSQPQQRLWQKDQEREGQKKEKYEDGEYEEGKYEEEKCEEEECEEREYEERHVGLSCSPEIAGLSPWSRGPRSDSSPACWCSHAPGHTGTLWLSCSHSHSKQPSH